MVVLSGMLATCNQLKSLEVAFNNILRRIWKLPRNSHTSILHKVAQLDSIYNRVIKLSDCFSRKMCGSKSSLLRDCYNLFYTSAFILLLVIITMYLTSTAISTMRKTLRVLTLYGILAAQLVHCGRLGRRIYDKNHLL